MEQIQKDNYVKIFGEEQPSQEALINERNSEGELADNILKEYAQEQHNEDQKESDDRPTSLNNKEESKHNLKGNDNNSKSSLTSEKENEKLDNRIFSEEIEEEDLQQDLFDDSLHPYPVIDENDESYKEELKVRKEYEDKMSN